MKRIIMHWSAGTYVFNVADRLHYHFAVDGDGVIHTGQHPVSDNENIADGVYAAHTLNLNTGSIGIAVCAMGNAVERPFTAGDYPIRPNQLSAFIVLAANLARQYGIPISRETVLSHAEVQTTLGVVQNGKWDIKWLPGLAQPDDPVKIGDVLRSRIAAILESVDGRKPESAAGGVGDDYTKLDTRLAKLEHWAGTLGYEH